MAKYLNIDGLELKLGKEELEQIASNGLHNSADGAAIDKERVEDALMFADNLIDSHILRSHPFLAEATPETAPSLLSGIACDIARYRLRNHSANKSEASDLVERRYDEAVQSLEDIRDGEIDLQGGALSDGENVTSMAVNDDSILCGGADSTTAKFLEGY